MESSKKSFEELENISMSGFFIKTKDSFVMEKEYNFDLKLESGAKKINILGRCAPVRFVLKTAPNKKSQGVGFVITYLEPKGSEELFKVINFNKSY